MCQRYPCLALLPVLDFICLVCTLIAEIGVGLFFVLKVLYCFKMAVCLSFSDIVEGKSIQLSLKVAAGKSIDTVKENRDTNLIKRTMPSNFGGKEKSFSQCSTVRTHDPEHNQDLIRVKSVNNPEHSRSNNRSRML